MVSVIVSNLRQTISPSPSSSSSCLSPPLLCLQIKICKCPMLLTHIIVIQLTFYRFDQVPVSPNLCLPPPPPRSRPPPPYVRLYKVGLQVSDLSLSLRFWELSYWCFNDFVLPNYYSTSYPPLPLNPVYLSFIPTHTSPLFLHASSLTLTPPLPPILFNLSSL